MANKKIPVAFCFDENMWMLGGVAIASLLYHGFGKCAYDVYCVVPENFAESKRSELSNIVAKNYPESRITFLDANHDFDNSVTHQYTTGIYFRFMLIKLLPKNIDKIIYADVDVAFADNLVDLYDMDMGNNLIAGVADVDQGRPFPKKGNYVNSGVLVMNVAEIRKMGLYDEWLNLSKQDCFAYPDQDILNKTCDGRILYLPVRYNYMPGGGGRFERPINAGIYTRDDYLDAVRNPAIIHYILRQPWKDKENVLGDVWWKYAAMTPFYYCFKSAIEHTPNLVKKDVLLFGFLKFMTIKVRRTRIKYYLFGFIPLFVVKLPDRF